VHVGDVIVEIDDGDPRWPGCSWIDDERREGVCRSVSMIEKVDEMSAQKVEPLWYLFERRVVLRLPGWELAGCLVVIK
jgi:hypothetical protein